eukprot:8573261-Pyramimonas_sp.AAC.1
MRARCSDRGSTRRDGAAERRPRIEEDEEREARRELEERIAAAFAPGAGPFVCPPLPALARGCASG